MKLSRRLRRASSTARKLEVLTSGNPQTVARYAVNREIGRTMGRFTRRAFLR